MYCYVYDKITKELIGRKRCQLDPIEKKYLMPANGTHVEPQKYDSKKNSLYFNNGAWVSAIKPSYIKESLTEKNGDGLSIYHVVNGKLTKKSGTTLKKELDAIRVNGIKNEASNKIGEYRQDMLVKILGQLNLIEDLSHITQLEEIAENGPADLSSFVWPVKPE